MNKTDEKNIAQWRSFIDGVLQDISFGFADELQAIGEAVFTEKDYDEVLNEIRKHYRKSKEKNPYAYNAGGVATMFIPFGGQAALARKIVSIFLRNLKRIKALKNAGKTRQAAEKTLMNNAESFISGVGSADVKEEGWGKTLANYVAGVGLSAMTGKFGEITDKFLNKIPNAVKPLDALNMARLPTYSNTAANRDRLMQTGKDLAANTGSKFAGHYTGEGIGEVFKKFKEPESKHVEERLPKHQNSPPAQNREPLSNRNSRQRPKFALAQRQRQRPRADIDERNIDLITLMQNVNA